MEHPELACNGLRAFTTARLLIGAEPSALDTVGLHLEAGERWRLEAIQAQQHVLAQIRDAGTAARTEQEPVLSRLRDQLQRGEQSVTAERAGAEQLRREVERLAEAGDAALDIRSQLADATRRANLAAEFVAEVKRKLADAERAADRAAAAASSIAAAAVATKLGAEIEEEKEGFLIDLAHSWKVFYTKESARALAAQRVTQPADWQAARASAGAANVEVPQA